jgi:hypothetical protein
MSVASSAYSYAHRRSKACSGTRPASVASASSTPGCHTVHRYKVWNVALSRPELSLFSYSLTEKGLEALRAWARTPVTFTPLKSELLLRLLVADLVGEAVTRESVGTLREDIADLQARVAEMEIRAGELPHRQKSLVMTAGFLRRLLALHLDFIDEVERELAP